MRCFNWRKNPPRADVKTDGVETPTKRILPPFVDTITDQAFRKDVKVVADAAGGRQLLTINGVADVIDPKRKLFFHGAIPQTIGGADEIPITVQDDREHCLTLIMADSYGVPPWARISLTGTDGSTGHGPLPARQGRRLGGAVPLQRQRRVEDHAVLRPAPPAVHRWAQRDIP